MTSVEWFLPSFFAGPSKTLYSTNMALSSSAGISAVQLVRTVGHTTTNHLIPALCTSSPQPLPMNNSCLTNAVHLNNVSVVSPVNVHINTRTSAPSPTALKLATVAASMDRVPKVTPSSAISSMARCVGVGTVLGLCTSCAVAREGPLAFHCSRQWQTWFFKKLEDLLNRKKPLCLQAVVASLNANQRCRKTRECQADWYVRNFSHSFFFNFIL